MSASAVPAATSTLLALARAAQATTLAGVEVVDGPPTLVPAGVSEAVVLGADWEPNEAVVATSTLEPYSDYAQLERMTIPGAVMVKTGDATATAATVRAYALLDAVKALLVAAPTLGGSVGYSPDADGGGRAEAASLAQLTSITFRRSVAGGTRCVLSFTVGAIALLAD